MSVKTMTSDQIRTDLRTINLTWPEAVPWQQIDRVNALKAELKRRGEDPNAPPAASNGDPRIGVGLLSVEALEKELRELSDRIGRDQRDEDAQQRFADVRFELRKRAKAGQAETQPATAPLPPRDLELPSGDELPRPKPRGRPAEENKLVRALDALSSPELADEIADYSKAPKREVATRTPEKKRGNRRSFSAAPDLNGSVILTFREEALSGGQTVVSRHLSVESASALINELAKSIDDAATFARPPEEMFEE